MGWGTVAPLIVLASQLGSAMTVNAGVLSGEVSFKLYRNYAIVARGSAGNRKNVNFLIDTGAIPSVLDRRIAENLHLSGPVEKLSVFTKRLDTERVVVPQVQVGPLVAKAFSMVVRDLSFAEEPLGTRIDAIIGFDLLSKSPFTIDYQSRKIIFGPIDASLNTVPYEPGPGYALVRMKVRQRSLRLLVDTGASDLVLFNLASCDCQDAIDNRSALTWSNMGGEIRVQKVHLPEAYLGLMPWGARDVFVLIDHDSGPVGVDGLLGVASLKARRIAFDSEHSMMAWDP
jgi:predicted aspartyl protease